MRYASYWRPTANGKTDYLSITIVNGATAQVGIPTEQQAVMARCFESDTADPDNDCFLQSSISQQTRTRPHQTGCLSIVKQLLCLVLYAGNARVQS